LLPPSRFRHRLRLAVRPPRPGTPTAPIPTLPAIIEPPLTREAQLEERVRQLEAMVNQLSAVWWEGELAKHG
jgi:hypothetical protein